MDRIEILKELQKENSNLQLPAEMDFNIDEDKVLTIGMKKKGLTGTMQDDSAAFEGWAICLKAWLPESIDKVVVNGDFPDDKNNQHYKRFLYRLKKFTETYSWAETTQEYKAEIEEVFPKGNSNMYINVPRKEASEEATHCEAQLERAYVFKNKSSYRAMNHQLPTRIFNNIDIKEKNAVTPGGFIDIWGITNDDILRIFELKLPTNTKIGIISELMFYVNVMTDVIRHEINIPLKGKSFRSFDEIYKLYVKKGACKQIEGVFLADNFHPMIQEKQEDVLQIINNRKFADNVSVSFSFDKPNVEALYLPKNSNTKASKEKKTYKEQQKDRQLRLLNQSNWIFEGARGCGFFKNNMYPYVLLPKDSDKNLFAGIRGEDECTKYFENKHISWWGERRSKPTGHLLSSQIHCLNHLFSLRKDDAAVKAIIENATGLKIKEVYPSPLDTDDGFISFEFVCKNKTLLGEKHETRGANCTSIDALIYVQTKDGRKVLIPIEWKYTESYEKKKRADDKTVKERYLSLVDEKSNLKKWLEDFYYDPLYEFARQTLLVEQIIAQKPTCETTTIEADDYAHLIVRPNENEDIRGDIQRFKNERCLKNLNKVIEIDPQELLSPLEGNTNYKELLDYLQTRYWQSL